MGPSLDDPEEMTGSMQHASGPFDLQRFVDAQSEWFETALGELAAGAKRSHWMWFIFPQIAGLGTSATARFYAIGSLDEARAYLAHPVLGNRLVSCVEAVLAHHDITARQLMGVPDDIKLRSCLTLFARAADDPAPFLTALERYFDGQQDPFTLRAVQTPP